MKEGDITLMHHESYQYRLAIYPIEKENKNTSNMFKYHIFLKF